MTRFALFLSLASVVMALAIARAPSAATPCSRTNFSTELVKRACTDGGQEAAKSAMKAFNKDKKIKSCNQCHTKLAPTYELKKDAVDQFKKLGGR